MALPPGLAVGHYQSPHITIYDQEGDTFTKLADPAGLPPGAVRAVSFSSDNVYLATGHINTPFLTIYKRNGDTLTKLADPTSLPADQGRSVAFSSDTTYLAVGHSFGGNITIYKRSGDTFTALADPATLPAGIGYGAAFSPDDVHLVIAHSQSPYITIYKRDGDTFTKLADPAALPAGTGRGASFSSDGAYLAVGHDTSPYLTIYSRSGDTFTKLANPDALPAGNGTSVVFSPDTTYLAVGHWNSPYITIYKRSGNTFTKLANPATLPTGTGYGSTFSPDNNYLAVGHASSPYLTIYSRSGDTFTKLVNPATLPANEVYGVAFMHALAALLSGTITENGTPVSRTVRAYRRDTGALLGGVVSNGGSGVVTLNPSSKSSNITLSNNDLSADSTAGSYSGVRATNSLGAGKWYVEFLVDRLTSKATFGVANGSYNLGSDLASSGAYGYRSDGIIWLNGGSGSGHPTFTVGDVIGMAVDTAAGKIWWSKNGAWLQSGDPGAGTGAQATGLNTTADYYFPHLVALNAGFTARFKSADFTYSPPSGFSACEVAGDGSFSIDTGGYTGECQVVVLDDDAGTAYNALIAGRVVPVSG